MKGIEEPLDCPVCYKAPKLRWVNKKWVMICETDEDVKIDGCFTIGGAIDSWNDYIREICQKI